MTEPQLGNLMVYITATARLEALSAVNEHPASKKYRDALNVAAEYADKLRESVKNG